MNFTSDDLLPMLRKNSNSNKEISCLIVNIIDIDFKFDSCLEYNSGVTYKQVKDLILAVS